MLFTRACTVLALASLAGPAWAADAALCHPEGDGEYRLLSFDEHASEAHYRHGDLAPGEYFPDADGDGLGNPEGATAPCPAPGFVDNADDCDDAVAGAACECPCFTAEEVESTYDAWSLTTWPGSFTRCAETDEYTEIVFLGWDPESWAQDYQYFVTDTSGYQGPRCFRGFDVMPEDEHLSQIVFTGLSQHEACRSALREAAARIGYVCAPP